MFLIQSSSTRYSQRQIKARDTQVNLKALEKAEAKLAQKISKRSRKTAYESSKLLEANKGQKSYEELFLEVNPLQDPKANKGKSKDIHLENIDVNFGSLRILSNATLTLPHGRYVDCGLLIASFARLCSLTSPIKFHSRAGLIGRNGIGKSTLLRAMALREVAIPQHISILYVQQEVVGDDTPAIESVLQADVHRTRLMAEEAELNAQLQKSEDAEEQEKADGTSVEDEVKHKRMRKRDETTARLGEVQQLLVDIEADTGPSRAAELLAGLGFSTSDQVSYRTPLAGGLCSKLTIISLCP